MHIVNWFILFDMFMLASCIIAPRRNTMLSYKV